jgi:hypothetical protein
MITKSTSYALTKNHVIIEKGSKKAMRAKCAKLNRGHMCGFFDLPYQVYLSFEPVGHDFNKPVKPVSMINHYANL